MSEHITRLAERLQQQVGESHNKPTVKQFEEMLTDALGAEHLTVEPDTDEPETETEDDVPEGFANAALTELFITSTVSCGDSADVIVTPTAQERLAAAGDVHSALATASLGTASPLMHEMLPHVRLDMPYYSFGKMMPRALKD